MVQRRALREAQHLLELERSYGQLEARLVHSSITNVRVDGYPVTNPVGFTGKNLEVTVFNTFAPMTHINAIDTVVRELDLGACRRGRAAVRAGSRVCQRGDVGRGRHLRRHRRGHH